LYLQLRADQEMKNTCSEPAVMVEEPRIEISGLGGQGDGVVATPDGPIYIPGALPGEIWSSPGNAYHRLTDAPERVAAPCRHFDACGGCVAQHMGDQLYTSWKTGLVRQALAQHGIDIEPRPLWRAPAGSRRRVVLSAQSQVEPAGSAGGQPRIALGFRAAGSHDLVEVTECTIADARIVDVLPGVRVLLEVIAGGQPLPSDLRVHILSADNGIDVFVDGVSRTLSSQERARLAGDAQAFSILRLNVGGVEIFQAAHPVLRIGTAEIRIPAGVFVQAVAEAEAMMARMVVKALLKAKHVADLFCGLGTFTVPLASHARVLAVDNEPDAVAALADAIRHAQKLKPIDCLRRDLFREPLSRGELNAFDGVVFDPPRAGAIAQAEALARSRVPKVVAVSCNPGTLARDLRCLIDGGYRLESVTPIDQFLFSAHVEAVAVLKK
jgi:23S rRNA (uracil1939-C5)-methyltransferase